MRHGITAMTAAQFAALKAAGLPKLVVAGNRDPEMPHSERGLMAAGLWPHRCRRDFVGNVPLVSPARQQNPFTHISREQQWHHRRDNGYMPSSAA
jgi:hypothetical protein